MFNKMKLLIIRKSAAPMLTTGEKLQQTSEVLKEAVAPN